MQAKRTRRNSTRSTDPKGSNHSYNGLAIAALIAVIAIGFLIGMLMYSGPNITYDDSIYLGIAHAYATGTINFKIVFSFGILFDYLIIASSSVFGFGTLGALMPSFAGFVFLGIFSYLGGAELGGKRMGIISAFLVATAPIIDANLTRVLPDIATGAFVAASLYLLIRGLKRNDAKMFLFAGILAALAVYVKMEALIFVLCMLLVSFLFFVFSAKKGIKKHNKKAIFNSAKYPIYAAIGVAVFLLLYMVPFYYVTGNPLYAFENYTSILLQASGGYNLLLLPFEAANPIMFYNIGWTFYYMYPFGIFAIFFIAGCFLSLPSRDPTYRYVALIGVICFLFMFYGSSSLLPYKIFGTLPRFFDDIIAPMAIIGAFFADWFIKKISIHRSAKFSAIAIVIIFALILMDQSVLYAFLAGNNAEISGADALYNNVSMALINASHSGPVSLYVLNSQRLGEPDSNGVIQYLRYLLTQYPNISIYARNETCSSNTNTYRLLLISNGALMPYKNSNMNEWLSEGGCSVSILKVYKSSGFAEAKLYRITN